MTMETAEEADAAITALNSTELMGKIVTVEKVRTVHPSAICQKPSISFISYISLTLIPRPAALVPGRPLPAGTTDLLKGMIVCKLVFECGAS